ncbi:MAG: glycosyltransferase [Aquificae bacterium]|nr:glycosyltransferase [Aquificota bacterium]
MSVIIPVYNASKFIVESIDSVLSQTYSDLEIIVIDDASTDNSMHLIEKNYSGLISDGTIRIIKKDYNSGRADTANIGVKHAKGNVIFFLDADDIWKKEHIKNVLGIFNKNKDIDAVYTIPRTFIDEHGKVIRISKSRKDRLEELLFSCRMGFPSATAFRRNKFLLYNNHYKYREDIELLLRSYLQGIKIKLLDINTVLIREHSSPFRMSLNENFWLYTLKLYEDFKDKIPKEYVGHFCLHVSLVSFKFGHFKEGWHFLLMAIRSNPYILKEPKYTVDILKRAIRFDRVLYNLKR